MISEDTNGKHVWWKRYESEVFVYNACARFVLSRKSRLQSLEPSADVSDATVEVDARSPFVLVLTIPAGLVSVLFLFVSSCSTSMFARAITHTRVCTRATDY